MTFGFIGYGSIAKKHILAISKLYKHSEVILVRRDSTDIIENIDNINFTITASIIDLHKADFIFITNPTSLHVDTIQKALEFKKPLFIEKPLSNTFEGVEVLQQELNDSKLINYIACNLRFHPCISFLKLNVLPALIINEVNVYAGSYLPDWRPGIDYRKNYSANAEMGGGVHLDLIHELDYCYYLFGNPAKTFRVLNSKSSLHINAIDYAHYFWEYNNYSLQITLNYYRRDYKRTIEIVAEDATYLVDLKKGTITKNEEIIFSADTDMTFSYQLQIDYFVKQAQKNEKCYNDINEASHILKLCLNES